MKKTLNDIKLEYGEVVLNASIMNLIQKGIDSFTNITLRESLQSVNSFFEKSKNEKLTFPITEQFVKQILNCEYDLIELNPIDILTYFNTTKEAINGS